MDDLSRALGEVLLSDLECPVCTEYMVPPIQLCTNGHNICSKCRESVKCCPTCRAEYLETRNLVLENIVRSQKYPCANRRSGCLELFSVEHIAKHHTVCLYGKLQCPWHLYKRCSWNGLKNDLKEHLEAAHSKHVIERSTFPCPAVGNALGVVSYFGELFTFNQQKKDGRYYAAVQLIGTSSEASKYKCEFTLRAANGVEQISKTFFVPGYSEEFETIFNSGKCFKLDDDIVKNFIEENQLKLTVTLSKV